LVLVISPGVTVVKVLRPLNKRIVVLKISGGRWSIGLDYLFTKPFAVYGIITVVGQPPGATLVEDIDIVPIGGEGDAGTGKAAVYSRLPSGPSVSRNLFLDCYPGIDYISDPGIVRGINSQGGTACRNTAIENRIRK
jgi:hypothetical protein